MVCLFSSELRKVKGTLENHLCFVFLCGVCVCVFFDGNNAYKRLNDFGYLLALVVQEKLIRRR